MINDLKADALTWKYVDDTTIAEIIPRNTVGGVQTTVSSVEAWLQANRMELNAEKCKEMIIDFTHNFLPLVINAKELPVSIVLKF